MKRAKKTAPKKPAPTPDVERTTVTVGYEYTDRLLREIDTIVTVGLAAHGQHRTGEYVFSIPQPEDTLADIAFRVWQLRNALEIAKRVAS